MSEFNDLPDEIKVHIFSFIRCPFELFKLQNVCKSWFNMLLKHSSMDSIIFHIQPNTTSQTDLSSEYNKLQIQTIKHSKRRYKNIKLSNVSIKMDDNDVKDGWESFGEYIEYLQFVDCSISDMDLLRILTFCRHLHTLKLNDTYLYYSIKSRKNRIYDEQLLKHAHQTLNQLKVLDFSGDRPFGLNDSLFLDFVAHCIDLNELNLSACKVVFHAGIVRRYYYGCLEPWLKATQFGLTFPILMHVLESIKNLNTLNLSRTLASREHILQIISNNKLNNLRDLILNDCIEIEEETISYLRNINTNLNIEWTTKILNNDL